MSILRIKGKIVGNDKESLEAIKSEDYEGKPTEKPKIKSDDKIKKQTTTKNKE